MPQPTLTRRYQEIAELFGSLECQMNDLVRDYEAELDALDAKVIDLEADLDVKDAKIIAQENDLEIAEELCCQHGLDLGAYL